MMNLMKSRWIAPICLAGIALGASACLNGRHPALVETEFPGVYVPKKTYKTAYEKIPGHGRWAMAVNEGEGFAYVPEDGAVTMYDYQNPGTVTASGEFFDPDAMTASHRSLPMHTIVRVTRVDDPESIEVRINDRSPEIAGRALELTPKAAKKLGIKDVGAAPCRIEVLRYPIVETTSLPPQTPTY